MNADAKECLKLKNQLCFPLYAAARRVTSAYTPYLKPLGLTYTQYIVFLALWEENPMSVGNLCKVLHLDNGTLTPLLKKLENDGFVTRERSKDDERVVMVSLTAKGRGLQEKAADIPSRIGGCIDLSPEEKSQLYQILYKLLGEQLP